MAVYCNKECEEVGALCDYCIHYIDDNEGTDKGFAGEGICNVTKDRVDACDYCDEHFHCTLAKQSMKQRF